MAVRGRGGWGRIDYCPGGGVRSYVSDHTYVVRSDRRPPAVASGCPWAATSAPPAVQSSWGGGGGRWATDHGDV